MRLPGWVVAEVGLNTLVLSYHREMWSQQALGTDPLWLGPQGPSGHTKPGCIGIAGQYHPLPHWLPQRCLGMWSFRDWDGCGGYSCKDPPLSHSAPRWGKARGHRPALLITGHFFLGRKGDWPPGIEAGAVLVPAFPLITHASLGPDF